MNKCLLLILGITSLLGRFVECQDSTYTGELPPITIGSVCTASEPDLIWSTNERSRWEVTNAIMTPAEIALPEHWPSTAEYLERISEFQIVGNDIDGFSEACSLISLDLIQGPADLYLELSRTNTTTVRSIRCLNDVWSIESESTWIEADSSGWVKANAVQYEMSPSDPSAISADILSKLSTINSQPGSDTRPNHFFSFLD